MPLIKNPFRSKAQAALPGERETGDVSSTNPIIIGHGASSDMPHQRSKIEEPEYKLSSVSPEGTFIPPSPPEKSSFLSRFRPTNTTTSHSTRRDAEESGDSGFVIPRASFDSYRRSFDIRPSVDGTSIGESSPSSVHQRPNRTSLDLLTSSTTASRHTSYQKLHPGILPSTSTSASPVSNGGASTGVRQQHSVLAPPIVRPNSVDKVSDDFDDFDDVKLDEEVAPKKRFWQRTRARGSSDVKRKENGNELGTIALKPEESRSKETEDIVSTQTHEQGHGGVGGGQKHPAPATKDNSVASEPSDQVIAPMKEVTLNK